MNLFSAFLILLSFAVGLGCGTPQPQYATGEGAELTSDGLRPVDKTPFRFAWVRPGVSFAKYDAIHIVNGGLEYRRPSLKPGPAGRRTNHRFPEEMEASLESMLEEALRSALTVESDWQMAEPETPEALVVRPAIIDLVVFVSPQTMMGSDQSWTRIVGEATYVAELFDAATSQVLARFVERREIGRQSGEPMRSDFGSVEYQSRLLITMWSRQLRDSLKAYKEMGIARHPLPGFPSPARIADSGT